MMMRKLLLLTFLVSITTPVVAIDYKNHNMGLINKHGWDYKTQSDLDKYLLQFYSETSGVIAKNNSRTAATIVEGVKTMRPVRSNISLVGASDHVIDTTEHIRPAIYQKWSPKQ